MLSMMMYFYTNSICSDGQELSDARLLMYKKILFLQTTQEKKCIYAANHKIFHFRANVWIEMEEYIERRGDNGKMTGLQFFIVFTSTTNHKQT